MDWDDADSDEERQQGKEELYEIQKVMTDAGVIDKNVIYDQIIQTKEGKTEDETFKDIHQKGSYPYAYHFTFRIDGILLKSSKIKISPLAVKILKDNRGSILPLPLINCNIPALNFTLGSLQEKILLAAEKGKVEVITELLGSDPSLIRVQDRDGYTPLHRASYSNNFDVVKYLLEHDADINARTSDGWTPLHSACKWNNFKCAALLLEFGADVNPLTNGGQTPLHLASSHPESKETLMLLLLNPQIHTNIRNNSGELASEIAHRHCKFYKLFTLHDESFNVI